MAIASPSPADWPASIEDVDALEELLSRPTAAVVSLMRRLPGPIVFLGAGGKMGPTIARMAKRASEEAGVERRVVAVSRFSEDGLEERLQRAGIETLRADLLDRRQLAALPDAETVVYMAGLKFGASGDPSRTWALNAYLPGTVMERYRSSRIAVFSTANVYGMTPLARGGAEEGDPPRPADEYSMSCLGRERVVEHFSRTLRTPVSLLRLNYAVEMRYGVLVDLARMVASEEPIDLTAGHLNAIWQGDANAMALLSLERAASPPFVVNTTGPELLSVRRLAEWLGELFGKPVCFTGNEAPEGFLTSGHLGHELFGYPTVPIRRVAAWTADWVRRGRPTLGKPTRFQVRDGSY